MLKVSIVTATYNSAESILGALESLNEQDFENLEVIVVDGLSTDKTIDIVKSRLHREVRIISESDNGIYDALNKGIGRAKGDVIGFLHSDDVFAFSGVITEVMKVFEETGCDAVYGDIGLYSQIDDAVPVRYWKSCDFKFRLLALGWMPPHTSLFVKKAIYDSIGGFNESYKISADYDFILRFFNTKGYCFSYLPKMLVKMKVGGASTKNLKSLVIKTNEDLRVLRDNNIKTPFITLLLKKVQKIAQFSVLR